MSGGSYDYLYQKADEAFDLARQVGYMAEVLTRSHPGTKASLDMQALASGLATCARLWTALAEVMHAEEWRCSGDWGGDKLDRDVEKYEKGG